MNKLDRPFLEKIALGGTYCSNYESYADSIIEEIENILSCRLKGQGGISENPFRYGIWDLLSQDLSKDELEIFRANCQNVIEELEPRVSNIEISDLNINHLKQAVEFVITCTLKVNNKNIYREMILR